MQIPAWHTLEADKVVPRLRSDQNRGLTSEEVGKRLAEFGPNELRKEERASPFSLFLSQFKNLLIVILLAATVLSLLVGEWVDALMIAAIVLLSAILGFIQEHKAERALEALKKMLSPTITALRDGKEEEVPSRDLVPGDIILLEAGDKIPAAARLVEVLWLNDEFGRIPEEVASAETKKTPLEKRTEEIGRWLGIISLAICLGVAGLSILREALVGQVTMKFLVSTAMFAIALAVAAVPEALAAIVTGALAIGMHEMAKRNRLGRKMPAVETLGCTTVICSDKTGTLTKGEMTVRRIFGAGKWIEVSGVGYEPRGEFLGISKGIDGEGPLGRLLKGALLCNDSSLEQVEGKWQVKGDPTEGALVVTAATGGSPVTETRLEYPRIEEIPFSSERKRMTPLHGEPAGRRADS